MNPGYEMVESIARDSYGRLIAYLSAICGDVMGAEDALSEAFIAALHRWPVEGLPEKPEAWLLAVARRRLADSVRENHLHHRSTEALQIAIETTSPQTADLPEFPDERLRLLFACAHPAIDETVRTPLMLQMVMGLDAARIASAFLVPPSTMSQRLVRAKTKIRDAKIPFVLPEPQELPDRLQSVLEAIYAAFSTGWDAATPSAGDGLASEALWLGKVVTRLLPGEPEALGLMALMLHCQARQSARFGTDGKFVPLTEQDVQLWSKSMIHEAETFLHAAFQLNKPGRFQLEAAIQSVHSQRRQTGRIEWPAIERLYGYLLQCAPTIGARIGHSVALGQSRGPEAGLTMLDQIPVSSVQSHLPYWAARAHLLSKSGRFSEAREAYNSAISLCNTRAQRDFLMSQRDSNPAN